MRLMSKQVVHQADHLSHLALDDIPGLLEDRIVRFHLPLDVQGIEDGRQGVAQLVGEQRHELFLAAIGFGQIVGSFPLGLLRLAFGQVVHHSGEGPHLFVLVEQRRHGGLAPEPRAVLPNLPADAVRVTGIQRRLQLVLRLAAANVFRRKQAGEVLPDDFRRRIAKEPFRSWVPAPHAPISADQENGVFPHIGHEQVKPLAEFLRR